MRVTRDNIDRLIDARALQIGNGRSWYTLRRNGKTRYWKRDMPRIAIPFKVCFNTYGTIDESCFDASGALSAHYRVDPRHSIAITAAELLAA